MKLLSLCFILLLGIPFIKSDNPCKPEQIHLALSDSYTSHPASQSPIKAIFHTKEACDSAYILLETKEGFKKITATAVNYFQDSYSAGKIYKTYVHIFDFPALEVGNIYRYTCHPDALDINKPKGPFSFYVPDPKPGHKTTSVVMFGDLDSTSFGRTTLSQLIRTKDLNFTSIAAYIHMGDLSYDLESNNGKKGDDYMNAVQDFAASMPYMISPGNHEAFHNFSNVNMRFKMPLFAKTQNHYYSYNLGNMHFASINLDLVILNPELMTHMADWLAKDLAEANANRHERPWIILYTHRPLYCSKNKDDCLENPTKFKQIEDIINQYKVDLYVSGHVHAYERMLPIKQGRVAPFQQPLGDTNFKYIVNPQAPVFVVQGMAGHEGDDEDGKVYGMKSFSVKVDTQYSFIALHSLNSTHLHVENINSGHGKATDEFYLIKSQQESFAHLPYFQQTLERLARDVSKKDSKKKNK